MTERKIIAVAQRKGGVGKTTIAISVAAELRQRRNDVLLVDSDPQQSASQWAEPGCLKFPVRGLVLGDQPVAHWVKLVRHLAASRLVIDWHPTIAPWSLPFSYQISFDSLHAIRIGYRGHHQDAGDHR